MLVLLLMSALFINTTYGNGILTPVSQPAANATATQKDHIESDIKNNTIISEGGKVVVTDKVPETLPKENLTILVGLDNELGYHDKKKPVKGRKGIKYFENDPTSNEVQLSPKDLYNTTSYINKTTTTSEPKKTSNKIKDVKSTTKPNEVLNQNKTEVHKKPLVLSYDTLSMMNHSFTTMLKSSTKTLVSDQLQSPNDESVKYYTINSNRHPGILMPLVITILVVPMFAVLGYMALKRGQEAWKNRHYKRMDFLLDGMYND